jgi:hypothetical protein
VLVVLGCRTDLLLRQETDVPGYEGPVPVDLGPMSDSHLSKSWKILKLATVHVSCASVVNLVVFSNSCVILTLCTRGLLHSEYARINR